MRNYTRFIRKRLQNLGVTHDAAAALAANFNYQISHMGETGGITYVKRCGDELLRYLYGTPEQRSPWVKTVDRFPKFFLPIKECSEEIKLRVAKLARAVRFTTIQPQQVDKVVNAVETPYGGSPEALALMSKLIKQGLSIYRPVPTWGEVEAEVLPKRITKTFHKVQSTSGRTANVKEPPVKESLQLLADHPDFRTPNWEESFFPIIPSEVRRLVALYERPISERIPYVGEIHAAQEGGGKLRMFASPYSIFQMMLYPLHWYLARVRKALPTDCTLDQTSGAKWAQEILRSGRTIHSVDLTTATCRFPLQPQIELLLALRVPSEHICALEYVCRGWWSCGVDVATAFARDSLQWAVGQPLGIAPSMSMFSLCHNLLLCGLCIELGLEPKDTFRVLGDDVVISDDDLAARYVSVLALADIPVSSAKSHSSTRFAEFAGYSITPDLLVRPGQWRPSTPQNYLSLCRDLMVPLRGEFSSLYERVSELLLFRDGVYSPPPEDWPYFIKVNTLFAIAHLEKWTVYEAEIWYYKIMSVIDKQLGYMVPYVWREPSFVDSVFEPVLSFVKDHQDPDIEGMINQLYLSLSREQPGGFNTGSVLFRGYLGLSWLWEAGAISQVEYHTLTDSILERARDMLYMPPRANFDNEVAYLGKQMAKLLKIATVYDGEDDLWSSLRGVSPS